MGYESRNSGVFKTSLFGQFSAAWIKPQCFLSRSFFPHSCHFPTPPCRHSGSLLLLSRPPNSLFSSRPPLLPPTLGVLRETFGAPDVHTWPGLIVDATATHKFAYRSRVRNGIPWPETNPITASIPEAFSRLRGTESSFVVLPFFAELADSRARGDQLKNN